jgi:heme-degrading monooxygenase HmoA
MFARMLEFNVKPGKKAEFINKIETEVLPILKKQPGFIDVLALEGETEKVNVFAISLWHDKSDAERYLTNVYPKVKELFTPYLLTPPVVKFYTVNPKLSEGVFAAIAA